MIEVKYSIKKDKVVFITTDYDDHIFIVKEIAGLKGVSMYDNSTWVIDPDIIGVVNSKVKNNNVKVKIDKTFKEWAERNRPKEPLRIISRVTESKIIGDNIPKNKLEDAMKYFFKPAVNMRSFKNKKWDGYLRLFDKRSNTFPTGLMFKVEEILKRDKIPYEIEYKYKRRPDPKFNWEANDKVEPDTDQYEAIDIADRELRGVLKAPTGFGKTAVLAVRTIANFQVPSLFIANKKALLDDAKDAFVNLIDGVEEGDVAEIKDGMFGDYKLKSSSGQGDVGPIEQPIVVATIQSISARLKDSRTRPFMIDWLKNTCELVMVDETQAVGTKTWDEVLDVCQAPLRFALSATPKRTDGATMKINAFSGDCIFFTTAEEQIQKGRLCDLNINYVPYNQKLFNEKDKNIEYANAYKEWVVFNDDRNSLVVKKAKELVDEGRFTLILINFIDHGYELIEKLKEVGIEGDDVRFVYGETKDKARKAAIKEFKKGKFKVLIGSTIFDAGVNIPAISGIVIAGAGRSEITLIQKIGRAARNIDYEEEIGYLPDFMKKDHGKKISKIYDIMDTNVKFFERQAWERYNTAKEEYGDSRVRIVGGYNSIKESRVKKEKIDKSIDAVSSQLEMLEGLMDEPSKKKDKKQDYSSKSILDIFD